MEADVRGYTKALLENQDFTSFSTYFFKILLEIPCTSNSVCENTRFFDRNPRFPICDKYSIYLETNCMYMYCLFVLG